MNYQGPDHGTQYRSAIFYTDSEQQKTLQKNINQLKKDKTFSKPIVTKLEPLKGFYPAEQYHQNYAALNPYNPYIITNDAPKLTRLKEKFPELYRE